MSKSSERFTIEWEIYKKKNNYKSVEQIIEQVKSQKLYYREQISRFKSGKIQLGKDDIQIFSQLFGIREEYLAGIDDSRTIDDYFIFQQNRKGIFTGLHQILVALGYADTYMENDDYNPTFPQNTYAFLESLKESLSEKNTALVCDVNADTYVSISTQQYELFLNDIVDYITFKLNKLFTNAAPMPSVILEDDSTLLHPSTTIKLKDGTSLTCNIEYIPNAQYDKNSLEQAFSYTEHYPSEIS